MPTERIPYTIEEYKILMRHFRRIEQTRKPSKSHDMTTDAKGPDETFGMAEAMKQTMDLILKDRPVDLDKLHAEHTEAIMFREMSDD